MRYNRRELANALMEFATEKLYCLAREPQRENWEYRQMDLEAESPASLKPRLGMYLEACQYLFNRAMRKRVTSRIQLWKTLTQLLILNIFHISFKKKIDRVRILGYPLLVGDVDITFQLFIDLFIKGIYHFPSDRNNPAIIDGGAHIGLSILYFKLKYPDSKLIGFEPDPRNYKILCANLACWGFQGVLTHNLALSDREENAEFISNSSEGDWGGYISWGGQASGVRVSTSRLSPFLSSEVDLIKLDIEGEEENVLTELRESGKLTQVRRIVLEFHHEPHRPYSCNSLAKILSVFEEAGFNYSVLPSEDAFELAWLAGSSPTIPVLEGRYQLLVYASRAEGLGVS
jgi:FkbM family methyltransferase